VGQAVKSFRSCSLFPSSPSIAPFPPPARSRKIIVYA
jgi:hypothetical protein